MVPCSKRIRTLLEWVKGPCIADIGCDHAYVAVNSILLHKAEKAYACDVAFGPLENAKKTIMDNEVSDYVIPCLMDGICGLQEDVDQIIIAGMGGKLIISILEKGNMVSGQRLLLSPHKDVEALRLYLSQNHILIQRERMVFDGNHYYPILDCIFDDSKSQGLSSKELNLGKNMVMDPCYFDFLTYLENKYQKILKQVHRDDLIQIIEWIKEIRIQSIS